ASSCGTKRRVYSSTPNAKHSTAPPSVMPSSGVYRLYQNSPSSFVGGWYFHGHHSITARNATPSSAPSRNVIVTPRAARFSALVPSTGHGSGYSTSSTPSSLPPRRSSSSRSISASSAAVGNRSSFSLLMPSPRSNPQGHADDGGDPDHPGDDALGPRSEAAQRHPTRVVVAVVDRLDEGDDVLLLLRRQLPVGELRHVLRTGEHRGVDLLLVRRLQRRRELPGRQRAALAGEVVARGAVEPEQLATARRVVAAQLLALLLRPRRAAAVRLHVGGHGVDLLRRQPRRLALGLRLLARHRHPPGRGLEVDRRLTDADQARAPSLDALEVLAVAGDARGVVDLGAFALQCAQLLAVRLRGLRLGREQGVKSAGDHERQAEGYQPGDAAALPARPRPAGRGDLLPGVSAPWLRRCHLRQLAVSSGVGTVLLSSP